MYIIYVDYKITAHAEITKILAIVSNFVILTLMGISTIVYTTLRFTNSTCPSKFPMSECFETPLSPCEMAICKYNLYRKCKCKAAVYNSRLHVVLYIKHPIVGPRSAFESILYAPVEYTFGIWKDIQGLQRIQMAVASVYESHRLWTYMKYFDLEIKILYWFYHGDI